MGTPYRYAFDFRCVCEREFPSLDSLVQHRVECAAIKKARAVSAAFHALKHKRTRSKSKQKSENSKNSKQTKAPDFPAGVLERSGSGSSSSTHQGSSTVFSSSLFQHHPRFGEAHHAAPDLQPPTSTHTPSLSPVGIHTERSSLFLSSLTHDPRLGESQHGGTSPRVPNLPTAPNLQPPPTSTQIPSLPPTEHSSSLSGRHGDTPSMSSTQTPQGLLSPGAMSQTGPLNTASGVRRDSDPGAAPTNLTTLRGANLRGVTHVISQSDKDILDYVKNALQSRNLPVPGQIAGTSANHIFNIPNIDLPQTQGVQAFVPGQMGVASPIIPSTSSVFPALNAALFSGAVPFAFPTNSSNSPGGVDNALNLFPPNTENLSSATPTTQIEGAVDTVRSVHPPSAMEGSQLLSGSMESLFTFQSIAPTPRGSLVNILDQVGSLSAPMFTDHVGSQRTTSHASAIAQPGNAASTSSSPLAGLSLLVDPLAQLKDLRREGQSFSLRGSRNTISAATDVLSSSQALSSSTSFSGRPLTRQRSSSQAVEPSSALTKHELLLGALLSNTNSMSALTQLPQIADSSLSHTDDIPGDAPPSASSRSSNLLPVSASSSIPSQTQMVGVLTQQRTLASLWSNSSPGDAGVPAPGQLRHLSVSRSEPAPASTRPRSSSSSVLNSRGTNASSSSPTFVQPAMPISSSLLSQTPFTRPHVHDEVFTSRTTEQIQHSLSQLTLSQTHLSLPDNDRETTDGPGKDA